jgi:predicted transcriptional regulator
MAIRLKNSPCKDCEFRVPAGGTRWECGLTKVIFSSKMGVYKCYSKNLYTPEELVGDIITYAKQNGMIKVKDVSRHLGLSYRKASKVLWGMVNAGVLEVLYSSPRQKAKTKFVLTKNYEENIQKAVREVGKFYPFARSTLEVVKRNRKTRLSSVELKRLQLILMD